MILVIIPKISVELYPFIYDSREGLPSGIRAIIRTNTVFFFFFLFSYQMVGAYKQATCQILRILVRKKTRGHSIRLYMVRISWCVVNGSEFEVGTL